MSKIVWITGCTKGLGRAMTAAFAAQEWKIAGCGRSQAIIDELGRDQENRGDFFRTVDLGEESAIKEFCAEALAATGPPDLLLNNAGVINGNAPLWEIGAEEFSRVIDINIKAVASMIRHIVPAMIERGSGVIVNFSSGWGRSTSPEVAPYCASKWAVEGLTSALAQELPAGLAAIALNPGVIDTEMLQSCFGSDASSHPGPSEWAKTAVPFLSKLSHRDNGKALTAP